MKHILKAGKHILFLAVLLLVPASYSCDEDTLIEDPSLKKTHIIIESGNNQTDRVGALLPKPLKVQIADVIGNPKSGITVTFTTTDVGASATPASQISDDFGYASCTFKLGTTPGEQHVKVYADGDSTSFRAQAAALECPEENPEKVCFWPAGKIFITTTSSSLLDGSGSVLIRYDPETDDITEVLETTEIILDLSFSSRGELFLTTNSNIYKVNHTTHQLEEPPFATYTLQKPAELEPNEGGVLLVATSTAIYPIYCGSNNGIVLNWSNIVLENLAVNPVTRDICFITGENPTFRIYWSEWDGRTNPEYPWNIAYVNTGTAEPSGMCCDSTGTIYITLDGSGVDRSIARITSDGIFEQEFFDFYVHAGGNHNEAGRWGDITLLDHNLYLIDKKNDRLVIISDTGQWVKAVESTAFSMPFVENERYGIAASPTWTCQ